MKTQLSKRLNRTKKEGKSVPEIHKLRRGIKNLPEKHAYTGESNCTAHNKNTTLIESCISYASALVIPHQSEESM